MGLLNSVAGVEISRVCVSQFGIDQTTLEMDPVDAGEGRIVSSERDDEFPFVRKNDERRREGK